MDPIVQCLVKVKLGAREASKKFENMCKIFLKFSLKNKCHKLVRISANKSQSISRGKCQFLPDITISIF